MRFGILGPLEVWDDERQLTVPGPQQRALLTVLLLSANRVVPTDRLIECLWGEDPPGTARALLQGCVSQLRRVLRTDRGQPLMTRDPGYLLEVGPGELDLDRFDELVAAARRCGDLTRSGELLVEALALWRGPALTAVTTEACRAEAVHLEERRLGAVEERIDVDLRRGRAADLVAELTTLVGAHPLRERLWAQHMLALYGVDRQAEALAAYRRLRETLVEQLGVEPSAMLQQVQRDILAGADALGGYLRGRGAAGRATGGPPASPAPAQLPAATTAFTGRTGHLARLDELLRTRPAGLPILVITGTAGVGKTALAVHWAHQVRDRFPDGQLYVNLRGYAPTAPLRPVDALSRFLLALGVPVEQVPADLDQAAALYRTLLTDKRVLVVLDNARTAEQVRPLLPGGPGCLVLVTSRDRLAGLVARDGADHIALDVLGVEEAVALLVRLLGRARVRTEAGAVHELAALCANLPLALRIAAANLTLHPGRAVADEVAALASSNRLGALELEGDEESAVRAAFDRSYAALEPDARRLFRLLGLVPGPDVTAAAAAALTGHPSEVAGRWLDRLAGAHLLDQHAAARFTCHDLLRLYAADRAHTEETAGELAAARDRLDGWLLATATAAADRLYPDKLRLPATAELPGGGAFATYPEALTWLDAERANLVAAVQQAATEPARPVAWLLADALRGYFWLRRYTVDWLAIARAALAAARSGQDLRAQAAAEFSIADAHLLQARYAPAIAHYTRAQGLARRSGWLDGEATATGNRGSAYWWSGRLDDAAAGYLDALALYRQTGRLGGTAANLSNLGAVYWSLGQLVQAADHSAEALELYRKVGSPGGEVVGLSNLGEICQAMGRLEEALDHLNRALQLIRETGYRGAEAETLRVLAAVYRDAGRYDRALELARTATEAARETGDRSYETDVLNCLASIYQGLGEPGRALECHRKALRLARETETRYAEVVSLTGIAVALCHPTPAKTRLDQAVTHADQAVQLARRGGFRMLEGLALTARADVHLARDEPESAVTRARQAIVIHSDIGCRLGEARALTTLGHALRRRGDLDGAARHWREADEIVTDIGLPADEQPAVTHRDEPGAASRPSAADR